MLGVPDDLRKMIMEATPIIKVALEGNALNITSNTDGSLFFFNHIIGGESEIDLQDIGGLHKVDRHQIRKFRSACKHINYSTMILPLHQMHIEIHILVIIGCHCDEERKHICNYCC